MKNRISAATLAAMAVVSTVFVASARAEQVVGLTTDNRIVTFNSTNPGLISDLGFVSGLASGETLKGIDLRPAVGQVFAVGSSNRIYSLNFSAGVVATAVSGVSFTPGLSLDEYGIDFNPTVDRIRLVNAAGFNGRLNPVTGGAVAGTVGPGTDNALTYATGGTPRAVGTAYTNSLAGVAAGTTRQFIIDSGLGILGEVGSMAGGNGSFNGGVVNPVGSLGFATSDLVGFDIFGPTGNAFVSLTDPISNISSLYSLSLASGGATPLGVVGNGLTLRDITIVPAPGAAAMGGLILAFGIRRRRAA